MTNSNTSVKVLLVATFFAPIGAWAQSATNSWVRFGVGNQREAIAQDEPINWVMRLAAHNAFESYAYGHDTDPNQSLTISSMMDRGASIIALDVHVLDGDLYLCHGDYCAFDKSSYDDLISEIGNLISVRPTFVWVDLEYLPYDGCTILSDGNCQDGSLDLRSIANKLESAIIEYLDQGSGLVWKPNEAIFVGISAAGTEEYAYPGDRTDTFCYGGEVDGKVCQSDGDCIWVDDGGVAHIESCEPVVPSVAIHRHRYPTLRELRRHNKRVMVTSTGMGGCCGDDCGTWSNGSGSCSDHSLNAGASCSDDGDCEGLRYATSWIWNNGNFGGTISGIRYNASDGSGDKWNAAWADFNESSCKVEGRHTWRPDTTTGGGFPTVSTISEDRTVIALSEGIGMIEDFDMLDLARCNVGRINLDFFDRAEDIDPLVCCWYDDDCIPGITLETECPGDDYRVARTIWSWAQSFIPDEDDDYVFMRGIDGRWVSEAVAENQFHCACGVSRTGEPVNWEDKRGVEWEVTDAKGAWYECPALCEAEFGDREVCLPNGPCFDLLPLVFSMPVNGFQNPILYEKLQEKPGMEDCSDDNPGACPNVWLKFRRQRGNGAGPYGGWTQQVAPRIDSVEIDQNPDNPLQQDFTFRIDNPDGILTQLLLLFDDGVSPFLDSPTVENGQTVYRYTRGFLDEGQKSLDVELYAVNDTSQHEGALYLQDSEQVTFQYTPNIEPTFIEVFDGLTREHLQEICADTCVGHLLDYTVRFTDEDADFTQEPDCSTQQLCQQGVRVLYGDGNDYVCNGGVCTGPSGDSCTDDEDCAARIQPTQISQYGPGHFEFNLLNLYQESGVFHGKILIHDGVVEVAHEFTVFNLEPSVDPVILPASSGCSRVQMLTGEEITCSILFVDENAETDTYAVDVDWGDGTPVENWTDVIVGATSPVTHLVLVSHVYETGAPDGFPIRVMVTDDAGLPEGVDAVCAADNVTPCTDDLDCGGTCRFNDSPNGSLEVCHADSDCAMACAYDPSQSCSTDADCADGPCEPQVCRPADTCRHRNVQEVRRCLGETGVACTSDADCASGTCGGQFEVRVFEGNTPPIACPIGETCIDESETGGDVVLQQGETLTRNFQIIDPDVDDVQSVSVRFGQGLDVEFPQVSNGQFTLSHTYDEPGLFEVVFRVSSTFEGPLTMNSSGALSFLVDVRPPNEVPVVSPVPPASIYVTETLHQTVTFTDDMPADPWVIVVHFGDGTNSGSITSCTGGSLPCDFEAFTFDMEHDYAEPGIYTGTIFITDQIGSRISAFQVEVRSLEDAYEPNNNCAAATHVQPGLLDDVKVIEGDEDWFSIYVGAGQELILDAEIVEPNDFTEFLILDDCNGTILDLTNTLSPEIRASYFNGGPGRDLYVQVLPDGPDPFPGVFDVTLSIESTCPGSEEDSDGDGIADGCDECPMTVPGAYVNEFGCPADIIGDADYDGDVDVVDFMTYIDCAGGPGTGDVGEPCGLLDSDLDGDVDLRDFGSFQRCFSGTDGPGDPDCMN